VQGSNGRTPHRCCSTVAISNFLLSAADQWVGIPAVALSGSPVPLQTFDELLKGVGADGSRAHSLRDNCSVHLRAPGACDQRRRYSRNMPRNGWCT
jgi:hypothetical protein